MADDNVVPLSREQVGEDGPTIVNAILEYRAEADRAKRTRGHLNERNMRAYHGEQDWSHKQSGQSQEFVPKTSTAVEQFAAFVKRGLTQFGSWYDVSLPRGSDAPLTEQEIRPLMAAFSEAMYTSDDHKTSLPVILSDAVKLGSLESLIILKVHGQIETLRVLTGSDPETGAPDFDELEHWVPRIDIVPFNDYYPDPTGQDLYRIHTTEVDAHVLREGVELGIYDAELVEMAIKSDSGRAEDEEREPEAAGQDDSTPKPSFRKKVVLDEFWGTLLDNEGNVIHRNVVATVANKTHLIQPPEPNPFWHQEDPFIAVPLIRVPLSVWHKALMDHAVELNLTQNELFSLMVDGGISSVWGIKQLRIDDLEDEGQVSDGIPQGITLGVKKSLPPGAKVLETVSEGKVPQDAMLLFETLSREFTSSALSNELKMGSFPARNVLATEVVELQQSQAATLDSIISDLEQELIRPLLRMHFLNLLQHWDILRADTVMSAIGAEKAFALHQMPPEARFAPFDTRCEFKVHGLSSLLSRSRDFQKIGALLQIVSSNPLLATSFFKQYSPERILNHMMKTLNINPENIARDDAEMQRIPQELMDARLLAQAGLVQGGPTGGGPEGGGGAQGASAGGEGTDIPAEVNQATNPLTGLTG